MVIRSVAANNGTGAAGVGGVLFLGASAVTGNATSWSGNSFTSYGDNNIDLNDDGNPVPQFPVAKK